MTVKWLSVPDTTIGLYIVAYSCATELDQCIVEGSIPLPEMFLGYDADDVDFVFIQPLIKAAFLFNDDVLYTFQYVPAESLIPQFQLIAAEYLNETNYLNNTDACFLIPSTNPFVVKGYQLYITDLTSSIHFLGDVTAPCLEENLEEYELPENFIISGRPK